MKDNNKFSGEFLKGPRKKCEDCGFVMRIPRDIMKSDRLECPKCGAIYRTFPVTENKYKFEKFYENNK